MPQVLKGDNSRAFDTGSRRDSDVGKPQLHRLMWAAILSTSEVNKYGDEHYGEGNWRKGQPASVVFDSMMRHSIAWFSGQNLDDKSGLNHLLHAAWNALYLVWMFVSFSSMYDHLDDRMTMTGLWLNEFYADSPDAYRRLDGAGPSTRPSTEQR